MVLCAERARQLAHPLQDQTPAINSIGSPPERGANWPTRGCRNEASPCGSRHRGYTRPMALPNITPMELVQQKTPFDHPEWLFEIKYDGFRSLAYVEDGCKLVSRNEFHYQRFYVSVVRLRRADRPSLRKTPWRNSTRGPASDRTRHRGQTTRVRRRSGRSTPGSAAGRATLRGGRWL